VSDVQQKAAKDWFSSPGYGASSGGGSSTTEKGKRRKGKKREEKGRGNETRMRRRKKRKEEKRGKKDLETIIFIIKEIIVFFFLVAVGGIVERDIIREELFALSMSFADVGTEKVDLFAVGIFVSNVAEFVFEFKTKFHCLTSILFVHRLLIPAQKFLHVSHLSVELDLCRIFLLLFLLLLLAVATGRDNGLCVGETSGKVDESVGQFRGFGLRRDVAGCRRNHNGGRCSIRAQIWH